MNFEEFLEERPDDQPEPKFAGASTATRGNGSSIGTASKP